MSFPEENIRTSELNHRLIDVTQKKADQPNRAEFDCVNSLKSRTHNISSPWSNYRSGSWTRVVAFSSGLTLPCCPLIHAWISSPPATPRPSQLLPASGHMAHNVCSMPNPILALASRVKPLMLPAVHGCQPPHTNPFWTMKRHGGRTVGNRVGWGGIPRGYAWL